MHNIKKRISQLLDALNQNVYEREEVVALSLLAAIAGESIFLLGPPGVGKSLVARRLKLAFSEGESFEYLMSRFSTPDEIFGPVSISKLKDEDTYERITQGYLPDASVVFLDEIWKAGPSIQNSLLTVVNEKIFRNGKMTLQVPLKLLIAASNELPAKGEGLEALYDRFLIRKFVGCIEQEYAFDQMIASRREPEPCIPDNLRIGEDEYEQMQNESESVRLHHTYFEWVHTVKHAIEQYNLHKEEGQSSLYVSDRRWKKITNLLRASAYLNGASEVLLADCLLAMDCLWDETEQIDFAENMVADALFTTLKRYLSCDKFEQNLEMMKDYMKAEHGVIEKNDPGILLVGTFYYRIEVPTVQGALLMFATDYQNLRTDSNRMFFVQPDRLRPANKILKVYDYLNNRTIPKDKIHSLRRGRRSVFIDNTEYKLALTADASPLPLEEEDSVENKLLELVTDFRTMEEEYKNLLDKENQYAKGHLFLSRRKQVLLRRVFAQVADRLRSYENELRAISHANDQERQEYQA